MNAALTQLAKEFAELKSKYDEQKELLEKIGLQWTDCENRLLDAMVEEGVSSLKIDGIGTLSMRTSNYLSVNAANKPGFYEYLQEAGHGGLLKLDVNPKTLTAFLKSHLDELIDKATQEGKDMLEARNHALEFLKNKGAAYFSKKEISLRKV
jgi:hypothetical protein